MPRWTEHDPLELLTTVKRCISEALKAAAEKVGKVKVKAVGITNQRETTVVWNKDTGKPLYNAIVWLDNRTAALCNSMEKELGSKVCTALIVSIPCPSLHAVLYRMHQTALESEP